MSLPDSDVHSLIVHNVLSNMRSRLRVPNTAVLCQIVKSHVLQPLTAKHVPEVAGTWQHPVARTVSRSRDTQLIDQWVYFFLFWCLVKYFF